MALVSMFSVAGAPGVTTTAIATALHWPRPVLYIEADTSKTSSILPGLFRGEHPFTRGLSTLSIDYLRGGLNPNSILDAAYSIGTDRKFVAGFDSAIAAAGTTSLWGALAGVLGAFAGANTDVIVDLGRLSVDDPRMPLVQAADSALLTLRPTLPEISAAKDRITGLQEVLYPVGHVDHLELLIVEDTGEQYSSKDVSKLFGLPVAGQIAYDPANAAVYSRGREAGGKFDRTRLERSIKSATDTTIENIRRRLARLGLEPDERQEASA